MACLMRIRGSSLIYNLDLLVSKIAPIIRRHGPAIRSVDGNPFEPYTNEEVYNLLQAMVDDLQRLSTDNEFAIIAALINSESTNKKSKNSDNLSSSTIETSDRVEFRKYLASLQLLLKQIIYFLNIRIVNDNKKFRLNQNREEKVNPRLNIYEKKSSPPLETVNEIDWSKPSTSAIVVNNDTDHISEKSKSLDRGLQLFTNIYYSIFEENISVASTSDVEEIENQLKRRGKKRKVDSESDSAASQP